MPKSKRGQEEIMGFIVIVVLIVVIGMIFIFMIKPRAKQAEQSMQVENLLSSIRHANSECDKEMQDVMIMCRNDETCGNEKACDYLKSELKLMIDKAIEKAGMGSVIGYNLSIKGISISINYGNSTSNFIAAISPIRQDIDAELRFYYP
jgi:hypothetical protein